MLINESADCLVNRFETFFTSTAKTPKLLRSFYVLILSLCFYSAESQQILFIQQLFKHITLPTITSDYFKVLAILVGKFGLKIGEGDEIPKVLLENILMEKNQLTIEGCAKLLINFNIVKVINQESIDLLWENCLFGRQTSCKKQQTRSAIYDLILKLTSESEEISSKVINKTLQAIQTRLPSIKITYSTEVNQRSSTGYAGLKNLGNICYMNSMIQQLFMNKVFRNLLMRIKDDKQPELAIDSKGKMVDDNFLHQTQRIFGYLSNTTRLDFIPSAFCTAYKPFGESVNVMVQQDVQEFVSMFFDRLQSGIKDHPLKRLVSNFYTGKYKNYFNCHQCKKTKKVQENFYSLSVQIKSSKNLDQSFGRFILGELINDYKCDFCGKKADVSKKSRISKTPQMLILHLQRIVFNLDTFVNEKISTKHQFPLDFNLYPYSDNFYEKQLQGQPNIAKEHPNYQYNLTGIICHIGNAENGHYVSYSRGNDNKWYDFNDSMVSSFNPINIESECFGGTVSYQDEYDWQRKQNSKNAYLLIYQKVKHNDIQLLAKTVEHKQMLIKELNLKELVQAKTEVMKEEEFTSQEESSGVYEDSEKEKEKMIKEMEEIQRIKKNKSEDHIDIEPQRGQKPAQTNQLVAKLEENIEPFMFDDLKKQIEADNEVHFFERSLASPSFSKFFAKLITLPYDNCEKLIKVCQKLTFGFWLKSSSFKELLSSLSYHVKKYPQNLRQMLKENTNLCTMLLEHTQIEVRANIAIFLAKSFGIYIEKFELSLLQEDLNNQNQLILNYLNTLIAMIPDTISKFWTKFNQYFEFWYQLSKQSKRACEFMTRKELIKHFADYFLDKKSPLRLYYNKPSIGSSYANPNFTLLLRTVGQLIQYYILTNRVFSQDQKLILTHFQFIEKLIHDGYDSAAAFITQILCPRSLGISEKIAVVLLKGMHKSNYESIQSYLDVLHKFVLIEDEYQLMRIKWVMGKPSLHLSSVSKSLLCMNSLSLEERIYDFNAAFHVDGGSSLLDPIIGQNKRLENFCMLSLQQVIKLCVQSATIRKYIYSLGPPSFLYAKYIDFFEEFITRYIDDSKRIYGYSSTGFNKEELGNTVKKLYQEMIQKIKGDISEEITEEVKQEMQDIVQEKVQGKVQEKTQDKVQEKQNYQEIQDCEMKEENVEGGERQAMKEENKENEKDEKIEQEQKQQSDQNKYLEGELQLAEQETNKQEERLWIQNQQIQLEERQILDQEAEPLIQQRGNVKLKSTKKKRKIHCQQDIDNDINNIRVLVPESPIKNMGKSHQNFIYGSSMDSPQSVKYQVKKKDCDYVIIHQEIHTKAYHPAEFKYRPTEEVKCNVKNVKIERHASELIMVRTYPTGLTNRSFTSTYSHKKASERLQDFFWNEQRREIIQGFFVNNHNSSSIRIQTDQGCCIIKSLDQGWVWAQEILRVWIPERSFDWPKWSLYSEVKQFEENKIDQELD